MAYSFIPEEQNTRIISTKINPRQYVQLDDFCKRKGFSSIYEFMQCVAFVALKFDDMWHGCPQDSEKQINDFLRPFLSLDNPIDYLMGARSANGSPAYKKMGGIDEIISIRQGGYLSRYRTIDGEMKVCHSVDDAALSVVLAGRPDLREPIHDAMQANRTSSFLELVRILLEDAAMDIAVMKANNSSHYTQIEYGIVPKKTHRTAGAGGIDSCIISKVAKEKPKI